MLRLGHDEKQYVSMENPFSMKKLPLLFVLCCLSCLSAPAQRADSLRFFQFGIHAYWADFGGLNRQSALLGYPALANEVAEFSLSYAQRNGRWLKSASVLLGVGSDEQEENDDQPGVRFGYAGLKLRTAYSLLSEDTPWFFGPHLAAQLRSERITLSEQRNPQGLLAASQASYLSLHRWHLPLQAGITLMRMIQTSKTAQHFMVLSLDGGYAIDTNPNGWRLDQALPIADHGINTAGLSAGFNIGFYFG